MNHTDYERELMEIVDTYWVCVDQNLRMIKLLSSFDVLKTNQEKKLLHKNKQIKDMISSLQKKMQLKSCTKYLSTYLYETLEVLLEIKNIEEELIEILENKVQFPNEKGTKLLIEYCICELGIRLFIGFKVKNRIILLNQKIYETKSINS
ncbi:hypothetical protein F8154_02685 [Alkaliphilus pronyensis]|uniref:DUF2935 domain-containing protein n=1 Tax=Alkaliphilus pronyensis TaxID=1482732 RepID=A0A6I0FI27_9FIRM|nr:hypothetical protein [Alkaliphilus pronyensis]KAB3537733.1 hypothetical protein F8154_02685 [Alkaliphilus pronyensis]